MSYYEDNKEKILKKAKEYNARQDVKERKSIKNREYLKNERAAEKRRLSSKNYRINNREKLNKVRIAYGETLKGRLISWRARAKQRGIPFSISLAFLESLPLVCFYTGEELTFKKNFKNTVSLDRIDSSKDYTEDNVVLCSWIVNQAKNDLAIKDFVKLCVSVSRHLGDKDL